MDTMCPKHPDYDATEKPRSMCQFCWAAWDGAEVERKRREAEENEVSKLEIPADLGAKELRKLALDICDNKIFTNRHCHSAEEATMCFPILMMMKLCDRKWIAANPPGLIYEYYSKASPTGINGLPMFFSFCMLNQDDGKRIHELVRTEMTRREAFLQEAR